MTKTVLKLTSFAVAISMLLSLSACNTTSPKTDPVSDVTSTLVDTNQSLEEKAIMLANNLLNGNYEKVVEDFSLKIKLSLSKKKVQEAWEKTIVDCGEFVEIEKTEEQSDAEFNAYLVHCAFEKNGVKVAVTYDSDEKIVGLFFSYYEAGTGKTALPNGIKETDVTVGEGSEWELKGKITNCTTMADQSQVAVVLVQGSGPSDMDETIMANKPFRDLAWGLAQKGIDSIRYDKRTFAHASKFAGEVASKLTVNEETVEDAILAGQILKEKGYKKIYLAGHSLGGMLAPRIQKQSNNLFDGLIILAGSTRTLTDIMIDQNRAFIATLTDEKKIELANSQLQAEIDNLSKLPNFTDEQMLKGAVFGMPPYYVRDLNGTDTAMLAKEIDKPILVLQGEKDFQVYADKDYPLWRSALAQNKKAEFILYDGLNHLFMLSQGEKAGTVEEYAVPGTVEQKVIDDIANFIKKK